MPNRFKPLVPPLAREKGKRIFCILASFFLILLIANLDITTSKEFIFSYFYLFPILWVTWEMGMGFGMIIALVSAISWGSSELIANQFNLRGIVLTWNVISLFGYFLISSLLLHAFRAQLEKERELSRMDFLTEIANSLAFFERANIEKSRSLRNKTPLTIVYLDCDYFKTVNDVFGHRTGDEVLKLVAKTLKENIRLTDTAARIAGDEFVVLLSETGKEIAEKVISRAQKQLTETMKRNNWPVTFSFGVASFLKPRDSVEEMVGIADNLMYAAKDEGRNLIKTKEYE